MPRPSGIESISQPAFADRGWIRPQLGSVGLVMSWYAPPPQMMMSGAQSLALESGRSTLPPVLGYVR